MGYFEENGYSLSTGLHHSEMAYSRFRRRRSFRRRPARTLRRSQHKRTVRRRRIIGVRICAELGIMLFA